MMTITMTRLYIFVYIYMCVCVCVCICIYVYVYIYMCVCVCVCMCVCIYIYIYIYPPIYTPLPNSRWLHHPALRHVRKVQRGAYMWQKGLNSIKTGSKWSQNTCLCTPNCSESLLEKRVFDPFLTHF